MTFVNGEMQAQFMTRIRGLDPQRCLVVPVDVGKSIAMALVADHYGEIIAAPFEFSLTETVAELWWATGAPDQQLGHRPALRSLTEVIDTTTPGGRLIFHVFGAVAEFERAIAAERTAAGVATARAAGRHPGRPGLSADTTAAVHALDEAGTPRAQIARSLGISRSSVYRCLELAK